MGTPTSSADMATVNVVLRASKADAKGRSPLYLRISDASTHRMSSLRVKVLLSQWNADKQEVRASHPEAEDINERIAKQKARVLDELKRRRWADGDQSAAALAGAIWVAPEVAQAAPDFFSYAEAWAGQLLANGQVYYYKRVWSALKKFRANVSAPLPFDQFGPDILKAHQAYMMQTLGNTANTACVSFTILRTIFKNAVREGVISLAGDPFLRFSPPKETRTERTKLSIGEIEQFEVVVLPPGSDLDWARDLFLFSLYTAGVRFGDAVRLRWRHIQESAGDTRLCYQMSKTGTAKDIKLNEKARAILAKYRPSEVPEAESLVFPLLEGYDLSTPSTIVSSTNSRNVTVNVSLKEVARRAGVKADVSFHIARHTFADLARRNGADVYKVSKALGHANLAVTARYLAGFDNGAADDALDIAFG